MRGYLNIYICFLLASYQCFQHVNCRKVFKVKEKSNLAYKVINLTLDFIDHLKFEGDPDKDERQQELINKMDIMHDKFDYFQHMAEKQPYKIVLSRHINKIESCKIDHRNFLQQPTSIAAIENLKKCDDIILDARTLWRYLSGHSILGLKPIFEYYTKDKSCNGLQINNMFQYLHTVFVDGCAIAVTNERIAFNQSSTLYRDECLQMVEDIEQYIRYFFDQCTNMSCSTFDEQVTQVLNGPEIVNTSTAITALEDNFPWYIFLAIESSSADSVIANNGTFALNSKTVVIEGICYHIFWTNFYVRFTKNKTSTNDTFVKVTISSCDYLGSSSGMNLSEKEYFNEKRKTFFGFTSNDTSDSCQYLHGSKGSSSASSVEKLSFVSMILIGFLCLTFL